MVANKFSNSFTFVLVGTLIGCAGATPPPTVTGEKEETMSKSEMAVNYEKECEQGLSDVKARKEALENHQGDKTVASVLEPLNALWLAIDKTSNTAGLYREVHPDAGVREAADKCEQEMQKLVTDLSLSRPIYDAVVAVDVSGEDAVTQRYVGHMLRDFRRAGVDRSEEVRQRVAQLKDELVSIGQAFGKNIRDDVRYIELDSADELDGLPEDFIAARLANQEKEGGKIKITTDYPDYLPYMTYAKNDARRLELYKVFRQRGYPKNQGVLKDLLAKRHELATLLGYKNWAHYITEDKMIKTPLAAAEFIEKLNALATPRAQRDYADLLAALQAIQPEAKEVGDWQKTYVEQHLKHSRFDLDPKEARQYFQYNKVEQGILDLVSSLFGVSFRRVDAPVWHESVKAFELLDDGTVIGRFYLDMHPRANKYKHAAAFPIRTGVAGVQVPEAALVCNFPGGDGSPGLMEHSQVETFLHEFGHLIHHLFGGEHRWVGVSGFNTEWDFVEAPSQLLEEWGWTHDVLQTFAQNTKGETIPKELVDKMRAARDFGNGLWVKHQLFYSALSLGYYNQDPTGIDTTAVVKDLQHRYSPFPYVDDTYFEYSFGHLDGYSAVYYTYLWSLVIAKDIFSRFQAEGMMNPKVAGRYRREILAPGGSVDAEVMVRNFLERDYTFDSFAAWLNAN